MTKESNFETRPCYENTYIFFLHFHIDKIIDSTLKNTRTIECSLQSEISRCNKLFARKVCTNLCVCVCFLRRRGGPLMRR